MGDAAQLRIRGFPQGRYVRIRFKALPAEFVTNFRYTMSTDLVDGCPSDGSSVRLQQCRANAKNASCRPRVANGMKPNKIPKTCDVPR